MEWGQHHQSVSLVKEKYIYLIKFLLYWMVYLVLLIRNGRRVRWGLQLLVLRDFDAL